MKLFYSDQFVLPLPEGHRFPISKYSLLRERFTRLATGGDGRYAVDEAPAATDQQLALAHCPQYVRRVSAGELSPLEIRRLGFPWSPQLVERARRSVGGTIAAASAALQDGTAANLAGGTHHASRAGGQGYCVFNDACVAARTLQSQGLVQRVLIVDCDVHQGNGTAMIAHGDPTLFAFSVHCDRNYPFQKFAGDLDVAVPEGTGDDEYLQLLDSGLETVFARFAPQLVIYASGADPYDGDRLGRLRLTKSGLRQRDSLVYHHCRRRGLPVAVAMAGGYAPNVHDIVDIHFNTIEAASQILYQTTPLSKQFLRQQVPSQTVPSPTSSLSPIKSCALNAKQRTAHPATLYGGEG